MTWKPQSVEAEGVLNLTAKRRLRRGKNPLLIHQVTEANCPFSGDRMIHPHHDIHRLVVEHLVGQILIITALRQPTDDEVESPEAKCRQQAIIGPLDDRDGEPRMLPFQKGHCFRQQAGGRGQKGADGDGPCMTQSQACEFFTHISELCDDEVGVLDEDLAKRRRRDSPRRSVEQLDAHDLLEVVEIFRDGRLRHMEMLGRLDQRAVLGNGAYRLSEGCLQRYYRRSIPSRLWPYATKWQTVIEQNGVMHGMPSPSGSNAVR